MEKQSKVDEYRKEFIHSQKKKLCLRFNEHLTRARICIHNNMKINSINTDILDELYFETYSITSSEEKSVDEKLMAYLVFFEGLRNENGDIQEMLNECNRYITINEISNIKKSIKQLNQKYDILDEMQKRCAALEDKLSVLVEMMDSKGK